MYRLGDILQMALTDVLEWNFDDLANLIVDGLRDANSSSLGQLFEANSNVHAGAVKIVLFGDHIPQVDANAELHSSVLGDRRVALRDLVLYFDSTANGLNDTGELSDDAVPCAAEDVTAMGGDRLLHHGTVHAQGSRGGFFVTLCEAAVACHIGSEYRSEPTLHDKLCSTTEVQPQRNTTKLPPSRNSLSVG